jgi:tripeptidyl-peptidase-2
METGIGLMRGLRAGETICNILLLEACNGGGISVIDSGAHVINMSYGEPASRTGFGRFLEMAREVSLEKGVLFVSSAGNAGPALTTVGAPGTIISPDGVGVYTLVSAGGLSPHVMGIGAVITNAMMSDQYSLRHHYSAKQQQQQQRSGRSLDSNYTWSSRGPAADGALGGKRAAI